MHAAVITAYKDFPMLERLTDSLIQDGFRVFIHIDKKSKFSSENISALSAKGCAIRAKYDIYWGSYSHLLAILDLMGEAVNEPEIGYIHTISGQDYPMKTARQIVDACDGGLFMEFESLEGASKMVRDRFERYKLLHPLEGHRGVFRPLNRALITAQELLGVRRTRTRTYATIFQGLIWMSLPVDAVRFVLESADAKAFLKELKLTYLPEEFFFQTVLAHSEYAQRIRGDHLRFMHWDWKHGVNPGILDMEDYEAASTSSALFARKVDSKISAEFLQRLRRDRGET